MSLRKSVATRVFFYAVNAMGAPVTGLVAADFLNGRYTVCKADGTKTDVSLTLGVNLYETDSAKAPGLYSIGVAAGELNVAGPVAISFQPQMAAFKGDIVRDSVFDEASPWEVQRAAHASSGTFGEALRLLVQANVGRAKIANNQLTIYAEDSVSPLRVFSLSDLSGAPTSTAPADRLPL